MNNLSRLQFQSAVFLRRRGIGSDSARNHEAAMKTVRACVSRDKASAAEF
jgi:hypothetical protein